MSETSIMSGINQIPYDKVNVMETLKEEAIKTLGQEKWDFYSIMILMLFVVRCRGKTLLDLLMPQNQENYFMDNQLMNLCCSLSRNNHIFYMVQEIIIRLRLLLFRVKPKNT